MVNEANGNAPAPQELETFLSTEDKKEKVVNKYNLSGDAESADFDPFAERKLDSPTSNMDTLTHLLKASLGTGILAMPKAFMRAGLVNGILFTILVAIVCTHCAYVLIKCAHVLYYKDKKPSMTFPQVGQASVQHGPKCIQGFANAFRIFILVCLFSTYFGVCSVYSVLIAKNVLQVVTFYMGLDENEVEIRIFIIALLVPLIMLAWVPDLKYLAPVSMIANFLMGLGLGITMYYLIGGPMEKDIKLIKPPMEWPECVSLTIFAMQAIGVVLPLENAMKTPKSLLGICGVLTKGMSFVCVVYIILGFLGFLRFGEHVEDSITLNLAQDAVPAQIVKIAIAIAVYCTFGLQFFVCIELSWSTIKHKYTKRPLLSNYIMRTVLVCACVGLAVAVPTIGPFMGVIGAFCFSLLGVIAPAFIEIVTFWDIGFGPAKYMVWKNILVVLFGCFALVFGTKEAVKDIIKVYTT
ncbi:unnamed protein product [Chrysodeixis includens]|uniref:Amino acid transporter transmembrane domain-containing protein n=1 Tax=Chrysodeixis includens TaxID=689277 RepID=A0A9P0BK57_CHRIL|nr:unnamed protein product [Chrysodeixis includens]